MNDNTRPVLLVILVVLAVVAVPLMWGGMMAGSGGPGGWMMGYGFGDGRWEPWRFIVGIISMVVIFGAIAAVLSWAFGRTSSSSSTQPSAREPLDARYARGEITREQYQQMRDDLRG